MRMSVASRWPWRRASARPSSALDFARRQVLPGAHIGVALTAWRGNFPVLDAWRRIVGAPQFNDFSPVTGVIFPVMERNREGIYVRFRFFRSIQNWKRTSPEGLCSNQREGRLSLVVFVAVPASPIQVLAAMAEACAKAPMPIVGRPAQGSGWRGPRQPEMCRTIPRPGLSAFDQVITITSRATRI